MTPHDTYSRMPTAMHRRDVLKHAALGSALLMASTSASRTAGAAAGSATASLAPPSGKPIPVAFLLDDGATMIDFSGPWEAFQDAMPDDHPGFELYTVAPTSEPVTVSAGMVIVPKYTLDNAPAPKVVVIPAQSGGRIVSGRSNSKIEWIKQAHSGADVIMSVCTGAFLLARTGLLDGKTATTHHDFFDQFAQAFPQVTLVRNKRYVDNGDLVTTAGLTSGVDGALHIIERYYSRAVAERTAAYMEHQSRGWILE